MSDDEREEEDESSDPWLQYDRDVEEVDLLGRVLRDVTRRTGRKKLDTLADFGAGASATTLLLGGKVRPRRIVCVDPSPDGPWQDESLWRAILKPVQIRVLRAGLFDEAGMRREAARSLGGKLRADVGYLHQTLHHLRMNRCKFATNASDKPCAPKRCLLKERLCVPQECSDAVGIFNASRIFSTLMRYARVVVVSENYYIGEDSDREKGDTDGGLLDLDELEDMFIWLLSNGRQVRFFEPFERGYTTSAKYEDRIGLRLSMVNKVAFTVA